MNAQISLTKREHELLQLLASGKTLNEISDILNISWNTASFHQKNIYRKLEVSNRVSALQKALNVGLLQSHPNSRKQMIEEVYSGYVSGNPQPLFDILHDDIEWISDAPKQFFDHAGRTKGKQNAIESIIAISGQFSTISFKPRSFIEDKDELSVILDVELVHLATGRDVAFDVAHFWLFEGDKVISYREVFNSGLILEQIGQLDNGTSDS